MRFRSLYRYLAMAVLLTVAAQGFTQQVDFASLLRKAIPEADRFSQLNQTVGYKAQNLTLGIFPAYKGEEQVAVAFYAAPPGYSGRIHTLTVLDMNGTVQKVSVFSHTESPAYVVPLNDGSYLRQFNGISLSDKLALLIGRRAESKGDIVVMSGATDTSKPIAVAVSEARKLFVELYRS